MPAEKTSSKASEARRSNKPLMEKRRRARINHSLTELKALILTAVKKDNSKHSKLEKADILEMTVKYLQNLQRQRAVANALADSSATNKFRSGYGERGGEVSRFLERGENEAETETRPRLIDHSSRCGDGLNDASPPPTSAFARDRAPMTINDAKVAPSCVSFTPTVGGVKLIPTRLTNGELAFVLPTTSETTQKPPANAVLIETRVWRPW